VRVSDLRVRPATPADAAAVARIHNQGIEDRVATFETELRDPEQVAALLGARSAAYPAVVAVDGTNTVVGFAWTSPYTTRPCYAGIGEFSVYVAREQRGRGIGTALLDGLAAACTARGMWKLVSRVFPENTASRALCRRAGFREVGVHRRHAQLDGEWRDVVIVERLLDDGARVGSG
jgi:L-amino acid N-acyltransferase YncA